MRVVVGTVAYPQAWKWKEDFVNSLKMQTNKDFDLLVINDGIELFDLQKIQYEFGIKNAVIVNATDGASISQNRKILLKEAKNRKYDLIILCDFDDCFSKNRVEKIKEKLDDETTFYYNNLRLIDSSINIFEILPAQVFSYRDIAEKNFLGLSNTAINLNKIDMQFIESLEEVETNVFDWYFFSRLLLNGNKGRYITDTFTYYRQQENNLAGLCKSDEDALEKEICIKLNHYKLLKKYVSSYSELYEMYLRLEKNDSAERKKYLNKDNAGVWWNNFQIRRN